MYAVSLPKSTNVANDVSFDTSLVGEVGFPYDGSVAEYPDRVLTSHIRKTRQLSQNGTMRILLARKRRAASAYLTRGTLLIFVENDLRRMRHSVC